MVSSIVRNVCFLAGLGLIAAGCWWIWPPLALLVVGLVLIILALWGTYHAA